MRNDYFTTTELIKLLHISATTLYGYMDDPDFLPSRRIGTNENKQRYIVDKMPFFEWYFRMHKDCTLERRFPRMHPDHEAIQKAYTDYIRWKTINQEAQRIKFVENKRPVYRRKGSYGF